MVEHEATGVLDRITILLSRVTMCLTAVVVVIMFYEVIARYLFDSPTLWANEMSRWIADIVFLFAGLYVMQQRGHIAVFILYDQVPRSVQKIFNLISTVLIVAFVFALVWGGFNNTWNKFITWELEGTAFNPPIPATVRPLMMIIMVLVALQAVSNLIHDWSKKEKEVHSVVDDLEV